MNSEIFVKYPGTGVGVGEQVRLLLVMAAFKTYDPWVSANAEAASLGSQKRYVSLEITHLERIQGSTFEQLSPLDIRDQDSAGKYRLGTTTTRSR